MSAHRLPRPAVEGDTSRILEQHIHEHTNESERRIAEEDGDEDEALPSYTPSTAPPYSAAHYNTPLLTLHLRQYDRNIQMLGTYGSKSAMASYRITTNTFRVFSKKPEMQVLYTSSTMRQRNIAAMRFETRGALPWCPRARVEYFEGGGEGEGEGGERVEYKMEARDFTNWIISVGGREYVWMLSTAPCCALVLREVGGSVAIAKFVYSARGTLAGRGMEVGELVVFRDGLTVEGRGVDVVVCSLMVAIRHLKKVGRHYRNDEGDELVRAVSLMREDEFDHRVVSVGFPLR